jgi:hypothetical protein
VRIVESFDEREDLTPRLGQCLEPAPRSSSHSSAAKDLSRMVDLTSVHPSRRTPRTWSLPTINFARLRNHAH